MPEVVRFERRWEKSERIHQERKQQIGDEYLGQAARYMDLYDECILKGYAFPDPKINLAKAETCLKRAEAEGIKAPELRQRLDSYNTD